MQKSLLCVLVLALALAGTEGRRPPPRKFPPPRPPPPSPKPPSPSPPPPPPSLFEYPHNCNPGNPIPNGQNAGITCTPFQVTSVSSTATSATFSVAPKAVTGTCTRVRGSDCGAMLLGDVKFAINTACWGTVANMTYTHPAVGDNVVSPVFGRETYPVTGGPGMTARIVFRHSFSAANVTGLQFTVTLRGGAANGCRSPATFFNTGKGFSGVQYGYFPPVNKACCGTAVTPLR